MCITAGDSQILSRVFLLSEVRYRYPNILAAQVSVDAAASLALQKRRERRTEDGRAARRALGTVVSASAASLFYISRLDFCETSASPSHASSWQQQTQQRRGKTIWVPAAENAARINNSVKLYSVSVQYIRYLFFLFISVL